jgi:tRNA C32,U32 (ribose-2'-O)-methylase TrmJ
VGTIQAIDASNVRRPELVQELSQMFVAMAEMEQHREHRSSIEATRTQVVACLERAHQRALLSDDETALLRHRIEGTDRGSKD